jgi:hypothetical protein
VSVSKWGPIFQRIIVPLSLESTSSRKILLDPEEEGTIILRKFCD